MFSTPKNLGEVTIFWLGDGKRVLVREYETLPYCKSWLLSYKNLISVSDSSAHFVAEFLHWCSVKSRLSLQPWDAHRETRGWSRVYDRSWGLLYDCVSWFQNYFLFRCIITIKKMKSKRSDVVSSIRKKYIKYKKYVFKTISWNIKKTVSSFV